MTRTEHMDWAKERAIAIARSGDIKGAWASMVSDLGKHDETAGHAAIELGMMMLMGGHLSSQSEMIKFIEDFN